MLEKRRRERPYKGDSCMKKSKILIVALLIGLLLAVGTVLISCGIGCKGNCGYTGCNDKCPQTSEGCRLYNEC